MFVKHISFDQIKIKEDKRVTLWLITRQLSLLETIKILTTGLDCHQSRKCVLN